MQTTRKIDTTFLKVIHMREISAFLKPWLVYVILFSMPVLANAEDDVTAAFSGFSLGGYAAAQANVYPGGDADAAIRDLSLFLSWEGDSRWRFFSELELEKPLYWQSGSGFTVTDSKLNLERLYLDYNLSEAVNLRAGRFFNPVGRWNLIHADPLVWTTTRPLATTRLFPQSTNGFMAFGSKSINAQTIDYSVYVEALKNENKDRNLGEAEGTKGLHLALSGEKNLGLSILEFTEHTPSDTKYRVLGLDFQTKINGWELSTEAFQRYKTNGNNGGSGGYIQAVAPIAGNWFAVTRLDTIQIPKEDNTSRWLIGAAWKRTIDQVFKIEYVGGTKELPESPKGLITSFSILF
jgi:hypothetical protein